MTGKAELTKAGIAALRRLARDLDDSPLRDAVRRLLESHARRSQALGDEQQ